MQIADGTGSGPEGYYFSGLNDSSVCLKVTACTVERTRRRPLQW